MNGTPALKVLICINVHDDIEHDINGVVNNQYDADLSRTVSIHASRPTAFRSQFRSSSPSSSLSHILSHPSTNKLYSCPPHAYAWHIHKYKNSTCNKTRARPIRNRLNQKQCISNKVSDDSEERRSTRLLNSGNMPQTTGKENFEASALVKGQGRTTQTGGPAKRDVCVRD